MIFTYFWTSGPSRPHINLAGIVSHWLMEQLIERAVVHTTQHMSNKTFFLTAFVLAHEFQSLQTHETNVEEATCRVLLPYAVPCATRL